MAKSKIIKELANSEIDTVTALKRLKVLLLNLDKEELIEWIDKELNGYKKIEDLPPYRLFKGIVKANFIIGVAKYTDCSLPTINLPDDIKEFVDKVPVYNSIASLNTAKDGKWCRVIPPEFYQFFTESTNITSIISAFVETPNTLTVEILSIVENKVLDILVLLENEFGKLDDLDFDISEKKSDKIEELSQKIVVIIYNDQSIKIGDNNKVIKSTIASIIDKQN